MNTHGIQMIIGSMSQGPNTNGEFWLRWHKKEMPKEKAEQAHEICCARFGTVSAGRWTWSPGYKTTPSVFYFKNEDDAVVFKLITAGE